MNAPRPRFTGPRTAPLVRTGQGDFTHDYTPKPGMYASYWSLLPMIAMLAGFALGAYAMWTTTPQQADATPTQAEARQ
jgi:hypothetical protein